MQVYTSAAINGFITCHFQALFFVLFCFAVHGVDNERGGENVLRGEQMKNAVTDLKHVDGSQHRHGILSKPEQFMTKHSETLEICVIYCKFKNKKKISAQQILFLGLLHFSKKRNDFFF